MHTSPPGKFSECAARFLIRPAGTNGGDVPSSPQEIFGFNGKLSIFYVRFWVEKSAHNIDIL